MGTTQLRRHPHGRHRTVFYGKPLAVGVVLIASIALVVLAVGFPDARQPAQATGELSTIHPPKYEYLRVSVLGDEYARGAGTRTKQGYADILSRQLCWRTTVDAEPGSGFVVAQPGSNTYGFPNRIAAVTANDPELIIVQSSAADPANGLAAVQSAVVLGELKSRAPSARIVVVGPLDPPAVEPDTTQALRSEIRASADSAGVTFVDPLDETTGRWLGQGEYSSNGFVPNSSGHASIARRLTGALNKLDLPRLYACDAVN
ncbi:MULTISPECIES: SGNH/GDSL hydrolase family protein [unclassified Rhodococcus (in: high G+C Gram-positive bacteria)]|uniref:SGNH/GDSL hydrolase family protein n=1 Tax=unclassified Rhodococcus (in: high G+C Gram-positive bacteria) TaxID=192944 RepID=UPI000B9B67A8|nr:hypothetical protein CH259_18870 [Rhodococcus sp. 05-2254-4]OZE51291.1 hypothetical protein CH261_01555 [Rhodococcus sp. 05-2254-3]OZE52942.1 hypothetical protein CH283_06645 [Rhodococcus sp. 05-2254-2]